MESCDDPSTTFIMGATLKRKPYSHRQSVLDQLGSQLEAVHVITGVEVVIARDCFRIGDRECVEGIDPGTVQVELLVHVEVTKAEEERGIEARLALSVP